MMCLTYRLDDVTKCLNSRLFGNDLRFHVEMMGLIGAGNNPMVGMTVAVAVAIQNAQTK